MAETKDSVDNLPGGNVVLNIVKPPKLTSFTPEVLVEWKRAKEKYVQDLKEACTRDGNDPEKLMVSIKSMVEPPSLLKAMAKYEWDANPDDLTDDFLMEKVNEITAKPVNDAIPDPEKAFEKLKWNVGEKDVMMRVVKFMASVEILMEDGALEQDMVKPRLRKKILLAIVDKVRPEALRLRVKAKVDYDMNSNTDYGMKELH
jgi:hypothetical protein